MRTVILVPWRGGDPLRERAWAIVQRYYDRLGWPMFLGDSDTKAFSVARAYNRASEAAGDWDMAVMIGADCVAPLESVRAGVEHAAATGKLTLPHDSYLMLKPNHYPEPPETPQDLRAMRYHVNPNYSIAGRAAPAGVVCIPRAVWDRVGGYDERFVHWGYEDSALLVAVGEFDRLPGPLWHYYHAPRQDKGDPEQSRIWREEYRPRVPAAWLVGPGKLE